ncbi:hypothetical protein CYMTET_25794 [Cymbomonas tetramitiformis]|uniref:Thioredoxin domain-containing protein n=1 Tax=Cymbomonas tetramitiformis TaxID=36881 RepID=A0AAE0FTP8_9CHLO|nr:hypothetical protein CYMTET_25794 [Cymbomonas tetramitiformis]
MCPRSRRGPTWIWLAQLSAFLILCAISASANLGKGVQGVEIYANIGGNTAENLRDSDSKEEILYEDEDEPLLQLHTEDFHDHINGHKQSLLLFCSPRHQACPRALERFSKLTELVEADKHLAQRTVVAYINADESPEIAYNLFQVAGFPNIQYLGWGVEISGLDNIAIRYTTKATHLYELLVDHLPDEVLFFRLKVLDKIAKEFVLAQQNYYLQKKVYKKAAEEVKKLPTAKHFKQWHTESGKLYLQYMQEIVMGKRHRAMDIEEDFQKVSASADAQDLSDEERWQIEKKLSVMGAFMLSHEADRQRAKHQRSDKHFLGRSHHHHDDEL